MFGKILGSRMFRRGHTLRRSGAAAKMALAEGLEGRRLLSATVTTFATPFGFMGTMVVDGSGNVYGTTGATIFELPAGSRVERTVATFPCNELAVDAAGNVYGGGDGGLFELSAGTHALSKLPGPDNLSDLIADPAGNLYGFKSNSGNDVAQLVEIAAGSRTISSLATINYRILYDTESLFRDSAGNLFWFNSYGGDYPATVNELAAGTHTVTTVYQFSDSEFDSPDALVVDPGGNVYATAYVGTAVDAITAGVGSLVRLPEPAAEAGFVGALIVDTRGDVFGVSNAEAGGDSDAVFELAAGAHRVTVPLSFTLPDGFYPLSDLSADASGNLYGVAADEAGDASVYEISGSGFVAGPSAPVVLGEPNNETGIENSQASFTASVGSVPAPTVQWQVSTDAGKQFSDIVGNASATTSKLVLTGLTPNQNGTRYRAVFSNSLGTAITQSARLAVVPLGLAAPAHASPSVVTGTTTILSALGVSASGESGLVYHWSIVRSPAGAARTAFGANDANAARHTPVSLHKAGDYIFRCTITDGRGATIRSDIQVEVLPWETSLRLMPHDQSVVAGKEITFHGVLYDQFGHVMAHQYAINYSVVSGPGTIDPYTGVFSSPLSGAALIEASDGDLSGTAGLQVVP